MENRKGTNKLSDDNNLPVSLAFQLLEGCPYKCPMCHQRTENEHRLDLGKVSEWIDILYKKGVRRITLTGGEPMLLGDELFQLCEMIHSKKIHLSLNTAGYELNKEKLQILDEFLDQILLSFRGLDRSQYHREFGVEGALLEHNPYETALNIIEQIKYTGIKLEIATVVDSTNINHVIPLGWKLLSLNPNIIWRVEEYYANGLQQQNEQGGWDLELGKAAYDELFIRITETFIGKFYRIRHSSKEGRINAEDVMLTPAGNFVTSKNNEYNIVGNLLSENFPPLKTRRSWADYMHGCRDWGWADL